MPEYVVHAVMYGGDGPDEYQMGTIHGDDPQDAVERILTFLKAKQDSDEYQGWFPRYDLAMRADAFHTYEADSLELVEPEPVQGAVDA